MPKKAVLIYLLLALAGAAVFIYFTFPRTRDEIPQSNNQRPFPSSPGPNGMPVPETVPHPTPPLKPPGPTLRVMAWATPQEAVALDAEVDAFAATYGAHPALTVVNDAATYRRELQQALTSDTPPDVCLVEARDFSGLEPTRELVALPPPAGVANRSLAAFTVAGSTWAVPDEFSVKMLFYHPHDFDAAGIAYPGRHWTWDILESMSRGLASLQLKNAAGEHIYPVELPADFDFWNILCTQAGHPALDRDVWHLSDADGKDSRLRGLDLIHEIFHDLSVTAPLARADEAPGRYFARQQAAMLIAPSDFAASLPAGSYAMTVLPYDLSRASLARVDGWAVTIRSTQPDAAGALARFLAGRPVHAGWSSTQAPADGASGDANLCYEALQQSLLPRLQPSTERLAQILDQQIHRFADPAGDTSSAALYAEIETEYEAGYAPAAEREAVSRHALTVPPKTEVPQLRGL